MLPKRENAADLNVVFYRDTNGWCPFCERTWLALEHFDVEYSEKLVSLQKKPQWYLDLVPTSKVPAIQFDVENDVIEKIQNDANYENCTKIIDTPGSTKRRLLVWESAAVLHAIDDFLVKKDTSKSIFDESSPAFEKAMNLTGNVQSAGFKFQYRNETATMEEQAAVVTNFDNALTELDVHLSQQDGPFLTGSTICAIDMMTIPMLERFRFQLPYSKDYTVNDGDKYPSLSKWFQALDALPSYKNRVRGDELSWVTTVSTFTRFFSPKQEDGTLPPKALEMIKKVDAAVDTLMVDLKGSSSDGSSSDVGYEAKVAAARVLINNAKAIVGDICNQSPKSQAELIRLGSEDEGLMEEALKYVACKLLAEKEEEWGHLWEEGSADLATVRKGCDYLSRRLSVPRDMGSESAKALRSVLLSI